jgi:hypothetical protein
MFLLAADGLEDRDTVERVGAGHVAVGR